MNLPPAWVKKAQNAERRLMEINDKMATGKGDWAALRTEHGRLSPLVDAYRGWCQTTKDIEELADINDDEMASLLADEHAALAAKRDQKITDLRRLLSPDAAENVRNCFLEIRAAVGGNESCLFAGDLFRLYSRVADNHHWKTELISHTDGEVGGYKEIIMRIIGNGAYGRLKFESGAHRVQRIPQTESQGRVHTSIVTIAVMTEAQTDDNLTLSPSDLRIETFRSSGAGGQHVNTTDSAVRITHLPTGIVAECQDDRSQHKNRDKAMAVLKARIVDRQRRERQEKEAQMRKSLVGSGDRSDRIRTYNFPQGRLTDHRIGLTLYKLSAAMEGDINEILDALAKADEEERLAAD